MSGSTPEQDERKKEEFNRYLRFGIVDSSILMISLLAGVSLDGFIAKRIGKRGYGALVGAGIGNAAADFIAGIQEGKGAAFGVGLGAIIPMSPSFIAMTLQKELTGRTAQVVGGTSAILFIGTMTFSYMQRKKPRAKLFQE